jgi:hypothetical protein
MDGMVVMMGGHAGGEGHDGVGGSDGVEVITEFRGSTTHS